MNETDVEPRETFNGFMMSDLGLIPEDWSCHRVGDITDLLTGFPFPSSGYADSGVLLVRGSNVKRGLLDWDEELTKFWPSITADIARYELVRGDIVVAMDGALVGRSYAIISDADVPSLLLQRVARLRSSKVDLGLLVYWIASDQFVSHVDSTKTHTAIPHISPADIRSFRVAAPNSELEQRAIAEALSDVDGLIGALEKLIAKKRAIKLAAMQQLLTGKTRLPGFSGKWESGRLGNLTTSTSGGTPPTGAQKYYGGGIPWVSIADMTGVGKSVSTTERTLTREGVATSAAKLWPPGSLLYAMYASIGECSIAAVELCASQAILGIQALPALDTEYLYYQLAFRKQRVKGMAQHGTQPNLNAEIVRDFQLPVMGIQEQRAIATVLFDMDAEIEALARRCEKTKHIKQGMMQQLLTGRVRLLKPEHTVRTKTSGATHE